MAMLAQRMTESATLGPRQAARGHRASLTSRCAPRWPPTPRRGFRPARNSPRRWWRQARHSRHRTARRGIVVLPFANRSPDADNEYFSDGLTEEIIADLARIKALSVISRTSAMRLKGTDKDVKTIGRELGVRYVLEGSVRKAGSSLRITAQLVDADSDAPLWSEKYSGTMDDVFEVQERVSREIVKALGVTLSPDEDRRLAHRPIENVQAFELYLQARQEIRRYDAVCIDRGEALIRRAIEIEGETPPLPGAARVGQRGPVPRRIGAGRNVARCGERRGERAAAAAHRMRRTAMPCSDSSATSAARTPRPCAISWPRSSASPTTPTSCSSSASATSPRGRPMRWSAPPGG